LGTNAIDPMHTTTPVHMRPRVRANALCYPMMMKILKKKLLPFLRCLKMLTMMKCPLMHLCVQAKEWGQTGMCWKRSHLRCAQRDRAIVPCGLPPINASKHCWDSARPLLHLALAGAKLWATTNH
jgi:hypothetical protein